MKKRFTRFLFLIITVFFVSHVSAQFPTIYATVNSGTWNVAGASPQTTIWETFTGNATNMPGAQGTGTPYTGTPMATSVTGPSGTHFVYIRAGHTVTMNGANRSCYGMFVEATGKIWANEAAARRLQLVNGGTGFLYPQSSTITNNGTMGGIGDGLNFEPGTNCQNVTITGTGSTIVQRLRSPGGLGSVAGGIVNIIIDQNITFTQANNYAISMLYNPQTTDNYTLTINAGKTVTISDTSGYVHTNSIGSGGGFGNYTYNINGVLDISPSITTQRSTSFSPTDGVVTVNVNGTIKTARVFNSSPVVPGVANLNIANSGVVDATLASTMNFNENSFTMTGGTPGLTRTIPVDGSKVRFPVGTANGSNTYFSVSNITGAAETITASIKNAFTNPAPANTLQREWNLVETTPGGNSDTLRFEWTTADQSNGFTGASSVFILHWNGTAWDVSPASVSGTGTSLDPYVAKGSTAFSQLGFFALSNSGTTPVAFVNVKAFQKQNGVQVEFGNATESDVVNYVVEKSANGSNFTTAETIQPKANNGGLSSYTYFDAAPNKGNNFYRIKVTERNGSIRYSNTLNIRLQTNGIWVNAYPNPVRGNNVNVQLENFDKSVYTISIYNQVGQRVYAKSISHNGGTATFTIDLPASVKKGMYNLQVSNTVTTVNNKIVVE